MKNKTEQCPKVHFVHLRDFIKNDIVDESFLSGYVCALTQVYINSDISEFYLNYSINNGMRNELILFLESKGFKINHDTLAPSSLVVSVGKTGEGIQ